MTSPSLTQPSTDAGKNRAAKHSVNTARTRHKRSKTKIMKANTKNNNPITLNGEPLEETDSIHIHRQYNQQKWRHRRRRQSKDTESKSCIHHVENNLESKTNQN